MQVEDQDIKIGCCVIQGNVQHQWMCVNTVTGWGVMSTPSQ